MRGTGSGSRRGRKKTAPQKNGPRVAVARGTYIPVRTEGVIGENDGEEKEEDGERDGEEEEGEEEGNEEEEGEEEEEEVPINADDSGAKNDRDIGENEKSIIKNENENAEDLVDYSHDLVGTMLQVHFL